MAHPWGVELRGGEAEAPRPAHAPWRERLKIEDQQDASVTNVLPLSRPGHFEGAPESVNVLLEKTHSPCPQKSTSRALLATPRLVAILNKLHIHLRVTGLIAMASGTAAKGISWSRLGGGG